MSSQMSQPTPAMLAARLFAAAQARAGHYRRTLVEEGSADQIRQMAMRGGERLIERQATRGISATDMTQLIENAENDLRRLVDLMAAEVPNIEGYPSYMLGERTLAPAMLRFCPCFPFC